MDRDQVNCLHYLYQGHPLHGHVDPAADPRLRPFWCSPDTSDPLMSRGFVEQRDNVLALPALCMSVIDEVESQLRTMPKPDFIFGYPFSAPIRQAGEPRPAFVAIPYRPEFDPVKATIKEAALAANFKCEITGDLATPGPIMDQVWQGIRRADVVVADITGYNPNVTYEMGLAGALGKEVIILTQQEKLPFDLSHWRTIQYRSDAIADLKTKLEESFGQVSARYPHEGDEPPF